MFAAADFMRKAVDYWLTGGPLLIPIALACFGIWAYFLRARRRLVGVVRYAAKFETGLAEDLADEPLATNVDKYARMPGTLAGAVAHVLKAVQGGREPRGAFDEYAAAEVERLGRDVVVLAALTAAAPLLGLLGTVMGMITTFDAVAGLSGNTASAVASGISRALITTQVGLIVAIPGYFGIARLHRLSDHMRVRLAACRGQLLLAIEGKKWGAVAS